MIKFCDESSVVLTDLDCTVEELNVQVFHAGTKRDGDKLVTNGGRVLTVIAVDSDLKTAALRSQLACSKIKFKGKCFRKDIASKVLSKCLTYSDSGVDIIAGIGSSFVSVTFKIY